VDASVPPYDPTALTGGLVYHWPVGTAIAIHVAPGPSADDDRLAAGTRSAIGQWPAVLGYREHTLVLVNSAADADVIVRDSRVPAPVDTGCAGSGWTDATAAAVFCPLGDTARTLPLLIGGPGRTKILITVDVLASAARVAGLEPVVLHEIGHALGIGGHSAVSTDAMFPTPGVRSPSLRDALTLRYVLHRRPDLTL
jgi:predicted Zn-dependent protease